MGLAVGRGDCEASRLHYFCSQAALLADAIRPTWVVPGIGGGCRPSVWE